MNDSELNHCIEKPDTRKLIRVFSYLRHDEISKKIITDVLSEISNLDNLLNALHEKALIGALCNKEQFFIKEKDQYIYRRLLEAREAREPTSKEEEEQLLKTLLIVVFNEFKNHDYSRHIQHIIQFMTVELFETVCYEVRELKRFSEQVRTTVKPTSEQADVRKWKIPHFSMFFGISFLHMTKYSDFLYAYKKEINGFQNQMSI